MTLVAYGTLLTGSVWLHYESCWTCKHAGETEKCSDELLSGGHLDSCRAQTHMCCWNTPACLLDLRRALWLERCYFLTDPCWTECFSHFDWERAYLTGDDVCWLQKTGPLFALIGSCTERQPCWRIQMGRVGKTANIVHCFAKSGICTVRERLKIAWFVMIILERLCQNKLQGVFLEMDKCAVSRCSYYTQHASSALG